MCRRAALHGTAAPDGRRTAHFVAMQPEYPRQRVCRNNGADRGQAPIRPAVSLNISSTVIRRGSNRC